jgi:TolB protein
MNSNSARLSVWFFATAALLVAVTAAMAGAQTPPAPPTQNTPLETNPVGIFEDHRDVGDVAQQLAGAVDYDKAKDTYTVSGSGENMWFGRDSFHFAWKRANGDLTLTADIAFLGSGKNPHRKAVLMIRQNLEADSAYADIALHGVGLTSLQYRDEKGATTHEVQANVSAPKRLRLIKHGDYFTIWLADPNGKFQLAGATGKIHLEEPFYVGIGVCSHEKDVSETAVFSNVELKEGRSAGEPKL